ncbi:MAG: hypothetical protein ACRDQ5_06785 [Sciscionella sp.]
MSTGEVAAAGGREARLRAVSGGPVNPAPDRPPRPSSEQRGTLPASSLGAPVWPQAPAGEGGPRWRPAPYVFELHCLGTGPVFDCGGEPITGTSCDRTAMVDEHARGGPRHWQDWPRCQDCAAREREVW